MINARLIGALAKFGDCSSYDIPIEIGFITDTTSCEEGVFTTTNPFIDMTIDTYTGTMVSQTQTVELSTAWGNCGYSYSITSNEIWLSHSVPASNQIQMDIQSSDMSLVGSTTTITVTLTPNYVDSDGFP